MNKKPRELYGIFRIDTQAKSRKSGTHGWQVRLTHNKKPYNKLFSDSVCGSGENALNEAKKFRDGVLIKINRDSDGKVRNISTELSSGNTSGIIGVSRTEYLEKSASITEAWQTAYPTLSGKVGTKAQSIRKEGEMAALKYVINGRMEGISDLIGTAPYIAVEEKLRFLVDYYLNILVYLDSLSKLEEDALLEVINDKNVKNTDKADVINGRVGQQSYRDRLLRLWGNKCAVTGASVFLVSSHIKPWAKASDRERLDAYNGIPLSPVYDKAFDTGHITFDKHGCIVIAKCFEEEAGKLKILPDDSVGEMHPFALPYLEYHRSRVFIEKCS